MKITILGSCSGTEPYPGRHHTSWVLEKEGKIYWFDAGECCAYTAYLLGIELLQSRCLFISHPHLDHVGGLPHLLGMFGKFCAMRKCDMPYPFEIFTPDVKQADAFLAAMKPTDYKDLCSRIPVHTIQDGPLYQDSNIAVEARHNQHLGIPADGIWQSFSFRIQCQNKTSIYSGDLQSVTELSPWQENADLLLMETGHHNPFEVCKTVLEGPQPPPRKLIFLHHGRTILNQPERCRQELSTKYGDKVLIADDGLTLEL